MVLLKGVNLLPATGEFAYDTQAYLGQRVSEPSLTSINRYANGTAGSATDYTVALNDLQAQFPDCETVSLVVAWFGYSTDITACQIYPSTTYIGGIFQKSTGDYDVWRCSGLTQNSLGLNHIPMIGNAFVYGGTPSDQSIVRCIEDLKARGFRVVFYPFILMTASGFPWRGRIAYMGADISSAASDAVNAFLGSAVPSQFTPDMTNLTVAYSGSLTDYTFRRMILHYANLCVVAGGVDLFLLGSEFRGIETIRGPAWTKAGTTGADGKVIWDYPFVDGLIQLSDDVRSVFDSAGLGKDTTGLHNLISYAPDWSDWMGFQHPGENGQWPHLDQLYAHANIDLVCFDNYLPLSDWTTGSGGLDVQSWSEPAPSPGAWPPPPSTMNGLGLSGQPTIYNLAYLKANIEGGEKFNWFYNDGTNDGIGFDPNGSDLRVSLPEGDRLIQSRSPYYPNQQLLANKQLRWWWNNPHQAIYDDGDGQGYAPHGPFTEWVPRSKSITFTEYGVSAVDRGTNQPNVFYDPKSSESYTSYWSVWEPRSGGGFRPKQDEEIQLLFLQAIYEYWLIDGHNATSAAGLKMIEPSFMSAWNWDARPFPTFPIRTDIWGDAGNWRAGQWVGGKGPFLAPSSSDQPATPPNLPSFPALNGQGWSIHYRPSFTTNIATHVSGRETRGLKMVLPLWEIELTFDVLHADAPDTDLQAIARFYDEMQGKKGIFAFPAPAYMNAGMTLACRFEDDQEDLEEFMNRLAAIAQAETDQRRRHAFGRYPAFSRAEYRLRLCQPIGGGDRRFRIGVRLANTFHRSGFSLLMTTPPSFPVLPGQSWSVHKRPTFSTRIASHVSGREVRSALYADTLYEFEITYDGLDSGGVFTGVAANSLQVLMGFYLQCQGQFGTFLYTDPTDHAVAGQVIALGDGSTRSFGFQRTLGGFSEPVSWVAAVAAIYLNGTSIPAAGLASPSAPSLSQISGGTLGTATVFVKTTYVTASGETAASSESSLAVSAAHLLQVASPSAPSPASATGWNVYVSTATGTEVLQNGATPIAIGAAWSEPTSGLVTGTAATPSANTTGWSLAQPNTLIFAGTPKSGVIVTADFTYAFICRFLDDQEDFENVMSGLWKLDALKFRSVKP